MLGLLINKCAVLSHFLVLLLCDSKFTLYKYAAFCLSSSSIFSIIVTFYTSYYIYDTRARHLLKPRNLIHRTFISRATPITVVVVAFAVTWVTPPWRPPPLQKTCIFAASHAGLVAVLWYLVWFFSRSCLVVPREWTAANQSEFSE